MSGTTASAYAETFTRVFDFIDEHLGEDLSVERLSQVANFSRFHFHRQFTAYAGMTVARYVQYVRLRRASRQLVFGPQTRILDIALEAGFESPEAFARAFKQAFGQTPSQFRESPAWKPWTERYVAPRRAVESAMEVRIVDFAETAVAALEHHGAPERVNDSIRVFIEWRKESQLSPITTARTFGVFHNDPENTPPDEFHMDICGTVTGPVPENRQGVVNKVIPAGRCAVVRHHGSHDRLGETGGWLYREWLPKSGETLRDFPPFFQYYVNQSPMTPEHEQVTDIYLPLQ